MWQYTAILEEHNGRAEDEEFQEYTKEDYYKDLEILRSRDNPLIQV